MSYEHYTIDLSMRNVVEGYVDSITLIANALRADGVWDWNLQRHLDQDVKDLRNEFEYDLDSILNEWEERARQNGWEAETTEGFFYLRKEN